jgi:hypothetical protein
MEELAIPTLQRAVRNGETSRSEIEAQQGGIGGSGNLVSSRNPFAGHLQDRRQASYPCLGTARPRGGAAPVQVLREATLTPVPR